MTKILLVLIPVCLLAARAVRAEEHPDMQAAQQALESARQHLKAAGPEYAGHRAKALERINQALEQIRLGLASAGGAEKRVERRERGLERREQRLEKRIEGTKQRRRGPIRGKLTTRPVAGAARTWPP